LTIAPPHSPLLTQDPFIGSSPQLRAVQAALASVAGSMATVFITGESGTGKELAALAAHQNSPRGQGPFIALNCGAIPPDLMESEVFGHLKGSFTGALADKPGAAQAADGGTLFLDEICEMALPLQTKLLRFLQTSMVVPVGATKPRRVDVRIICATNRDPMQAVHQGLFREDLFYRLYVVPLDMPPLRQRGEDVIEIARTALARFAQAEGKDFDGLSDEVEALFRGLDWPGNIRQLLNVIHNIVVLNPGGVVKRAMLPPSLFRADMTRGQRGMSQGDASGQTAAIPYDAPDFAPRVGRTLAEVERAHIEATLAHCSGSVPQAARLLDIAASTLYRKIESWKAG
jgi:two-component system repressor protein LuxO